MRIPFQSYLFTLLLCFTAQVSMAQEPCYFWNGSLPYSKLANEASIYHSMHVHSDTLPTNKRLNRIDTIYYHMKLEAYPKIKKNRNIDFHTSFLVMGYDSDTIFNQTFSCADSFTIIIPVPPNMKKIRIFTTNTAVTYCYRPLNIFRHKKKYTTSYKMKELVIQSQYPRDCFASFYGCTLQVTYPLLKPYFDSNTNINDFVRRTIPGVN